MAYETRNTALNLEFIQKSFAVLSMFQVKKNSLLIQNSVITVKKSSSKSLNQKLVKFIPLLPHFKNLFVSSNQF